MRSLYWELKQIFVSRMTRAQGAVILFLVAFTFFAFIREKTFWRLIVESNFFGIDPKQYITGDLFSRICTIFSTQMIIPIFVMLTASSRFAAEDHSGFLPKMIVFSKSRNAYFWQKVSAITIYTLFLIIFLWGLSFLVGGLAFGRGEMLAGKNDIYEMFAGLRTFSLRESLLRQLLSLPFIVLAMLPLIGMSIFVSNFCQRPLTAISILLSVFFGFIMIGTLPLDFFKWLTKIFFIADLNFWGYVFTEKINWAMLIKKGMFLFSYAVSFLMISWSVFLTKDFKN
jgi:hypothetical protein